MARLKLQTLVALVVLLSSCSSAESDLGKCKMEALKLFGNARVNGGMSSAEQEFCENCMKANGYTIDEDLAAKNQAFYLGSVYNNHIYWVGKVEKAMRDFKNRERPQKGWPSEGK